MSKHASTFIAQRVRVEVASKPFRDFPSRRRRSSDRFSQHDRGLGFRGIFPRCKSIDNVAQYLLSPLGIVRLDTDSTNAPGQRSQP